jgi:uncharacterized protein (TIGR02996 family)
MHPESDALLDAIFDAPDDDTPRLVYADWLQEQGQSAYADFIRLQCAAAREPLWSDAANRLWEEIGRVWTRLDEEWWPATRDVWDLPAVRHDWDADRGAWVTRMGYSCRRLDAVHFRRGFLRDTIPLTYSQLARYGGSCWPWLPLPASTLQEEGVFESFRDVLELPRLSRVRHLCLAAFSDEHDYWPLLGSPRLSNLETLDLSALLLDAEAVEGLLAPGLYPRLREVRVKVFDVGRQEALIAGCLTADEDASARRSRELHGRFGARFEKVVWLTVP